MYIHIYIFLHDICIYIYIHMYACENLEIWDICIQCIHMVCDDVAITPLRSSGQLKSRAGSITVKCRTIDEI